MDKAWLYNYETGASIREATDKEYEASLHAARYDGGCGVILVDGKRCFVR